MGVLCPEICLPARTLSDLSPEQVEALLAHEVWHVRRRDALWLAVQGWIAALFFFQPLNALAQRRLRETAEVLCDDGAVSSKDRRLALAECLARIADWTLRPLPALVPAMAEPASLLGRRLRRLLRPPAAGRSQRGGPAGLFAAASLAAVLAFAPGVRSAPSTPPPVPVETPSTPLGALDASLGALERDVRHVRTLLRRAGHPDLARRLARRLEALGARRDDLRYRLGDPGDER
jgi:beta-lactamase regulating signal transducer with metallopeptidase domain